MPREKRSAPANTPTAVAEPPHKRPRSKRAPAPAPKPTAPAPLAATLDGPSAQMHGVNNDAAAELAINSANQPPSLRLADCILFI